MSYTTRVRGEHPMDCQNCGDFLFNMSEAQVQEVAANPYDHIYYCRRCQSEGAHIDKHLM